MSENAAARKQLVFSIALRSGINCQKKNLFQFFLYFMFRMVLNYIEKVF